LRAVDEKELIAKAGRAIPMAKPGKASARILGGEDLAELFGLDMAATEVPDAKSKPKKKRSR